MKTKLTLAMQKHKLASYTDRSAKIFVTLQTEDALKVKRIKPEAE